MNINQGSYLKKIIKRGVTLLIIGTLLVPNVPMNVQAEASGDVDGSTGVASSTEVGGVQTDELGNRIVTETDTDTEDSTDTQNATGSDSQVTEEVTTESEDAVVSEESGSVDGAEVSNDSTEENSDTGLENAGEGTSEAGTEALVENENVSMEVYSETAGEVALDETNFPDAIFRKYIADTYDKDKNSKLSETEINSACNVVVSSIGSVKGIEYLSELKSLEIRNSSFENLDLKNNKKLEELYCADSDLMILDISENTELSYAYVPFNKLSTIKFGLNSKLNELYCNHNKLKKLDIINLTNLSLLQCGDNDISELNVSNNLELEYLRISGSLISQIDLSRNTKLKQFSCSDIHYMTSIDLSNNNLMTSLSCSNTYVSTIQWGDLSNYKCLNLDQCLVRNVDYSQYPELMVLHCGDNNLTELDVTKCPKLEELYCYNNKLTELDVSKCSKLKELYCCNNKLTKLDVTKCPDFIWINCENNNLMELDVSKCSKLTELYCSYNNLTALDFSNNKQLRCLRCRNNKICKLDFQNNTLLYELYCDSNKLVSLDLSNTRVKLGNYEYNNQRELYADKDGYVDLSVLETDGFDIVKASNWSSNVVVDTSTKKMKVDFSSSTTIPKQVNVSYKYDINNTYLGSKEFGLVITYRTDIAEAKIEMEKSLVYTGNEINGIRSIAYNGEELKNGEAYSVDGGGTNINVGTATIMINGINKFTGSLTKSFEILPASINDTVLENIGDQTYNGKASTPDVSIKLKHLSNYMVKDKDYTLNYANNTSAGTATVTITGKGNYTGDYTSNFKINPSNIAAGRIEDIPNQTYTGSEVKPGIKITANNTTIVNGTDYDLSYSNNVNLGTATVTATGKGNYTGSISKTYKIAIATVSNLRNSKSTTSSIKLKWDKASGVDGYEIYSCKTGSKKFTKLTTIKKASTTTYTNKKLKIGTAYSYKIRAYKTINGKKQYGEYTEVLNTTTSMAKPVVKLSAGSKKVTITYQKVSGANGYEIYMATSKKGTYENIKTLTKASKIKYTKTGLKKKKTYYFKVRAYKIVNGEKVYSSYSTVKKVKVK